MTGHEEGHRRRVNGVNVGTMEKRKRTSIFNEKDHTASEKRGILFKGARCINYRRLNPPRKGKSDQKETESIADNKIKINLVRAF